MNKPSASINPDDSITLARGAWSETFPAARLGDKIRFYQSLWAGAPVSAPPDRLKIPGKHAAVYQPVIDALRAIALELRQ